jgi:predicted nucleic acid-binding protein
VIVVDTNVLIYAHRSETERRVAALEKLTALAEGASTTEYARY